MHEFPASLAVSLFRGCRLALHLLSGAALAAIHPLRSQVRQQRVVRAWSGHVLSILNIRPHIEGDLSGLCESGCLLVANHISWLDIFVLNAIHPARFIAKAEVRDWPLIGWLCQRSGTIFIERARSRDAAAINREIAALLAQGHCVGLFPEGTTTDGSRVGHFHTALFQPALDSGACIQPVALRYQEASGLQSGIPAFTGEMTLAASIWRILRCPALDVIVAAAPALASNLDNRRVLALAAQRVVAEQLHALAARQEFSEQPDPPPRLLLAAQSAYVLLLDPILHQLHK